MQRLLCTGLLLGLLGGCVSTPDNGDAGNSTTTPVNRNDGRYSQDQDSYPKDPPNLDLLPELVPRYEPPSRNGNKDYEVLGKHYRVLPSANGFRQTGKASWYGEKFHGHLTSNGEIYDMYALSGAHKELPLPSYVRVTNVDNGKSTIVRVNDRGPFHEGRVIDLSYAAAYKLGVLGKGTANVALEAITVEPVAGSPAQGTAIQVAAVSDENRANNLAATLGQRWGQPTRIIRAGQVLKVQIGPFANHRDAEALLNQLRNSDYPQAFLVD